MNWWFLGDARARLEATGREMCFTGLVSEKKPLEGNGFLCRKEGLDFSHHCPIVDGKPINQLVWFVFQCFFFG